MDDKTFRRDAIKDLQKEISVRVPDGYYYDIVGVVVYPDGRKAPVSSRKLGRLTKDEIPEALFEMLSDMARVGSIPVVLGVQKLGPVPTLKDDVFDKGRSYTEDEVVSKLTDLIK